LQHGLKQLVLDAPGGGVGHAQVSLERKGGDIVLVLAAA
jgi:hypothetical protein